MKVKVFQSNHNGKIEFTRAELEKLLNETYTDGFRDGEAYQREKSSWTWTSPYVNSCDGITLTNTTDTKSASDKTISNYNADKTPTLTTALNCTNTADNQIKNNPSYTIKVNGTDISELVNELFGAKASNNAPEKVADAFDKLKKELNF